MGLSASIQTAGLAQLIGVLGEMRDAAESEVPWWVGTVVVYAPFLEFGTAKMMARPFWKPAVLQVAREMVGRGVKARRVAQQEDGRKLYSLIMTGKEDSSFTRELAFRLERAVKQQIRRKGLIDTGNLRASVMAAPGPSRGTWRAKSVSALSANNAANGTRPLDELIHPEA